MACMVVEHVFISSTRQTEADISLLAEANMVYLADIRPARYIKDPVSKQQLQQKPVCERDTLNGQGLVDISRGI